MRGGSQPGQRRGGRQKGTTNKASAMRAQAIAMAGLTPKQFLLNGLAFYQGIIASEEASSTPSEEKIGAAYAAGRAFANDVAPYCHSRLASAEPEQTPAPSPAPSERNTPNSNLSDVIRRYSEASVAVPSNGGLKH